MIRLPLLIRCNQTWFDWDQIEPIKESPIGLGLSLISPLCVANIKPLLLHANLVLAWRKCAPPLFLMHPFIAPYGLVKFGMFWIWFVTTFLILMRFWSHPYSFHMWLILCEKIKLLWPWEINFHGGYLKSGIHLYFWHGICENVVTTNEESKISWTLLTQLLSHLIKEELFFCVCVRKKPERSFMVKGVWGVNSWHEEEKTLLFFGLAQNLEILGFGPLVWEERKIREKKKREDSLLSIFFAPLYLLHKLIFNLWKDFRDLKKGFRSVKKKVFVRTSIPEETDQIGASSRFFVEIGHMYGCERPARIILAMSLISSNHRSILRYRVLNLD